MDEPARVPFTAARHAAVREPIIVKGLNLTGAAVRGQVRLVAGAGGSPLIDLPSLTSEGATGIRFVSVDTTGIVPVSKLEMCIPKATMESLPVGPRGQPLVAEWDVHVTPTGGTEFRLLAGPFIVNPGVTQ